MNKTENTPRLSILLLGMPQLLVDEQPLTVVRRKNRALLFYVAAHSKSIARDVVLTFFWPDHERAAAQQILRTMLHELRKQLGESLRVEDETIGLDAVVDVRQFESGLAMRHRDLASLKATLELYRGDFMHGFSLPDAPQYDDWVASERERYRLLAIRGLAHLAQLYESQRDLAAALETLDRALAFDPLQEDLQRSALRLHYLNGDRAGAVRRYESLRRLLDEEMGVPPMPETRAVYDAIVTDTLESDTPPVSTATLSASLSVAPALALLPFVGRADKLDHLMSLVDAGKLVLVEGEPGIGKTRLVETFLAALESKSPRAPLILTGSARELEQGLPYQPIIEALRGMGARSEWPALRTRLDLDAAWVAEIGRLVPELHLESPSSAIPVLEESRIWEALRQFLYSLTRQRAVILLLEDLQWADASTIAWLSYLVRHSREQNLLLVGTTRPVEPRTPLASCVQMLTRDDYIVRVPLAPLTNVDLEALAERLSPRDAAPLSDWLTRQTEGNPFFVTELVRYAQANRLIQPDGELNRNLLSQSATLPPSIAGLVESRLSRLSEAALRVLDAAAVIGREFDAGLVIQTSGVGENAALDALDELRRAVLVQTRPSGGFAFDHWLTMQTVLEVMSEARRRALHRRVAEALENANRNKLASTAGLIARHYTQAALPERAAAYAYQAGRQAAEVAAWVEAIAFYEQALSAETDATRRIEILIALGSAHFNHGDPPRAGQVLRAAAALAQENQDWARLEQAYLAMVLTHYPQGHYAEAIAAAQELRRTCPPDLALAAEFMWGMSLSLESTRPVEAEFHLREAEKLMVAPRSFTSRVTPASLKYQIAGALGQQGKVKDAIALYREVLPLVTADQDALDLQRTILLYNNLAYYSYLDGDLAAAADYARAGLKLAREKGSLTHQPYLLSTSGEIALAQNDLETAENRFSEGLRLAQDVAIPERVAGLTANLGLVARQRGDLERARALLADGLGRADALSASHLATRIRIWLAPLLPPDQAHRRLSEARAAAETSGYLRLLEDIARLERQQGI